jgi:hypothetical protein
LAHLALYDVASDLLVLRSPRSPRGQQDDGEHNHFENDSGDRGNFDVGNPSSCHAPLLAAVERQC